MDFFLDIQNNFMEGYKELKFFEVVFKLIFAAGLSSLIAFHFVYIKDIMRSQKLLKIAKAEILICVAGTILIIVIGDSVARAFGLFGLGSFIRFRTEIKDAMDTAIIFVLIGIGMAVGIGLYLQALTVWAFLYIMILILGAVKTENGNPKSKHVRRKIEEEKEDIEEYQDIE